MKNCYISRMLVSLILLLSVASVRAEDIDLFLGAPATDVDAPNVLFIIDNTGNWTAPFEAEMNALIEVFGALPENEVNVGIMLFTETGGGDSNVDGGYVRAAIRRMNTVNTPLYQALINSFDSIDDRSNSGKAGLTMAEAYKYYAGLAPEAGNNKVKTDYTGNSGVNTASDAVYALEGSALDSKGDTSYNSPIAEGFCGRNYIIWVGNGAAQDSNSDNKRAKALLDDLNGDSSTIQLTPSGSQGNMADEWARYMYQESGHAITTFTLDINKVTTGQGPGWTALLKSMAEQSNGRYYDVDGNYEDILEALTDVFSRILAEDSVFASVALPASANTQSTFLNQVYIGMFRPDEGAKPRWLGNLKQYKLGFDGDNVLRVLDQTDSRVVDLDSGFVQECARSFWTPGIVDTYWAFLPEAERRGNCDTVSNSEVSNYPDGPIVEKGAQAYVTRAQNPSTRVVYTCEPAVESCGTLDAFTASNTYITQAVLGAADSTERSELINWARGVDVDDENANGNTSEMRPSVHGDVVHSQPVAIDFAANPNDPNVVVFYGGNDGLLRAVNGNRTSTHSNATAGEEIWAFMPPEFFPHIKRIRDDDPIIRFPASGPSEGATGQPKPYGMDGAITSFSDADSRYIYAGLRRAGRSVYAFNVTDIENPSLLWRKGCPNLDNNTGCTSGWEQIGQTWSAMNVTTIAGDPEPVIVMGGGYDSCEDYDNGSTQNHNCASGSFKGNRIYIIDGDDGAILNSFTTERPVPGSVTIVPVSDDDRDIAFAYAADTGGNIYRISGVDANTPINSTPPAGWTMTKIAAVGCGPTATSTCTANRKFLFGPDVVRIANSDKLGIMLGSGDREKPLVDYGAAAAVSNYFYGIFDRPTVAGWLDDADPAVCNADMLCMDALTSVDTEGPLTTGETVSERGWKLALASGEQVVSGALTVSSVVNFSTHIPVQPDADACNAENLGTASTYNVGFQDGSGEKISITGGGLVPTPVAGRVILDSGDIVPFCIGCGGEGSSIGGSQVTSSTDWTQHKSRVYWNIEK